jgi:superfamily I DNA and/or RNA helicase
MMRYVASAQTDTLLQGIQDRVVQHKIDNNLPPELLRIATRWAAESQRTPRELEDRLRRGANLVFVTCGSATPQKLAVAGDDGLFDWAIIEEAARAWLPELALPLVRAARWALIGDYRQLPPFGAQELQRVLDVCEAEKNDDDDLKAFVAHKDAIYSATSTFKSLFVDMSNEPRPVSGDKPPRGGLKTQFRMDSSIGELINQSFYGGKLLCGTTERTPFLLYRPSWLEHKSLVWLDTSELPCEEHPRWSNPVEGKIAAALARALRVEGNAPADCALLSPYRAQVKRLEKYMGTDHSVAVKTVDSFQGKEADVVIISLVRQNSGQDALKRIGHLDNEARVNVMCSRAKRLLVLVGNYPHFDRTDSEVWNKLFTHFRALGKRLDAKKYFTPEGRALQW